MTTLFISYSITVNAAISGETGVHTLNTTRNFFKCIDDRFQGNGSFVRLMQEVEIIGKPEHRQFSIVHVADRVETLNRRIG
jgi:4-hydroxyphenylpyruvate dioxygenase-like putative hemolysin